MYVVIKMIDQIDKIITLLCDICNIFLIIFFINIVGFGIENFTTCVDSKNRFMFTKKIYPQAREIANFG